MKLDKNQQSEPPSFTNLNPLSRNPGPVPYFWKGNKCKLTLNIFTVDPVLSSEMFTYLAPYLQRFP